MSVVSQRETPTSDRTALIRAAFRIESITIIWMVIEGAVAITVELRNGQIFAESAERRAGRIGGVLLFALAFYVVVSAGWKLWTRQGAEFSLAGLIVTILAMPIMYFLSRRKLRLAEALGSRALRTDAVESITCGWLSMVVVAALLMQLVIGAWWVDAVASLGIVWFLAREGREAWKGEKCCDHCAWLDAREAALRSSKPLPRRSIASQLAH